MPGDHSAREPPDPIPNSEVKPCSADDSVAPLRRESRSSPGTSQTKTPARKNNLTGVFFLQTAGGDVVEASKRLLNFIDRSPTPWHAVASIAQWLQQAGFRRYEETEDWQIAPGACGYVVRDGGSIIAFRLGQTDAPMRIIGAHTDSPGFRVKPRGAFRQAGFDSLGIEVYGGPIIATFADRDLTLAGRIMVEDRDKGISTRLVNLERPLLRLPNLAIHLNRDVNQAGLRFDLQDELPLALGCAAEQLPADEGIRQLLGAAAGVAPETILSWELAVVDVQPGAFFGRDNEFIASA